MSLRTSLKKLIRRDPTASLRERAADLRGSLSGQTRRTVVAATAATAVPLLALANPSTAAPPLPIERAEYRARLLAAYEEDRLRRPISGRAEGGDLEEDAALLVGVRLWQTAREILALPPPSTIDGLVLTALAAMVLTEGDYSESDPEILAAVSLTRAVMTLTGTPYPAGFVGFGDEPDHEERDAAVYSGTGSLPEWAIEQAKAERLARAARTA
ncbi:hypothetical protein MRF4_29370 [Methylobacterium radiotolerans]|uniref:hypothetical protein n=1 Tax=Methylobacterium TaxID=407 RepID=UPI002F2C9C12